MTRKRTSSRAARAKGKNGERSAKKLLQDKGYHVASTEIQGLAGDDIFAAMPHKDRPKYITKWFAFEVKNTNSFNAPKFIGQAKAQAVSRYATIQEILANDGREADLLRFQGMDTFTKDDWVVLWHPNNCGCGASEWVVAYSKDGKTTFTDFASWERVMYE